MKIIIPMTGHGTRFVAAGYTDLKPFIKVDKRPIIEWIVKGMYPGEADFLFVCRQEHLDKLPWMGDYLLSIAPAGKIFAIYDWVKKGPVHDVLCASGWVEDDAPCIINYCDFYIGWNYAEFAEAVAGKDCAGAVPCYSGFHPHLLKQNNVYASCRVDQDDHLLEIREKFSFEPDKMKARHSPGNYYFKTGYLLKKYCRMLVEHGPSLNGEYYASLPYNYMVRDGLTVWAPVNVKTFCQWGTPEDLAEYLFWTDLVKRA